MDSRNIYIILVKSPTVPAKFIRFFKREKYSHAAIALDKELNSMFSFARKWESFPFAGCFKRENINEGVYKKHSKLPGIILELTVTEQQYQKMIVQIEKFKKNKKIYSYNYLGLIFNFFRLDYKRDYKFFCSEFVYYILNESGIIDLKMSRIFVSPQELLKVSDKVLYEGNLKTYLMGTFVDSVV